MSKLRCWPEAQTADCGESTTINHLYLGCGPFVRNAYNHNVVHAGHPAAGRGISFFVADPPQSGPVPHPDSTFDSISAFDFLKHIPRGLPTTHGHSRFPAYRVDECDGRRRSVLNFPRTTGGSLISTSAVWRCHFARWAYTSLLCFLP